MPLIVPVLRAFLLFLNVFDTFKTLEPPQRSIRTGERTVRALSQRKRDMKGCMAIWLVWVSCIILERIGDNTVGIVMPFYNEFKALIFLFQILTRARGAEPIYLHVMKPLVKPYVATLDWALDLLYIIGDFFYLPVRLLMEWWYPPVMVKDTPDSGDIKATEQQAKETHKPRQPSNGAGVGLRTRGVRQTSDGAAGKNAKAGPSTVKPAARSNGIPHSRSDITSNKQGHQIWRPPVKNGVNEHRERLQTERRVVSDSAASAKPATVDYTTPPTLSRKEAEDAYHPEVEEWRQNPPFPSAYPSTPQASSKTLPRTSSVAGAPNGLPSVNEKADVSMVPAEVEEWRQYAPFPSAYPATPQMVPKPVAAAPSTQHQPALDAVAEQEQAEIDYSRIPQPRDRRIRPKAPVSQSLPSRTGRRTKRGPESESLNGQDFGLSLERLRVSPTY
ncbi:hypothetical protein DFH11DRAFT_1723536 [Phellopilus nigrolimitatus]|nr:hypothetical protein DFH11DRAFT_1723536 [Phellopilus nigrolimitatus]